jgi:hypothetical protein
MIKIPKKETKENDSLPEEEEKKSLEPIGIDNNEEKSGSSPTLNHEILDFRSVRKSHSYEISKSF